MRIVLVSTYEMGQQPFGLASPAAWLRARGHDVTCADLSRSRLPREAVEAAEMVAFYLPMHTATRLALKAIETVRRINAGAHLCCFGLYAPMNEELLRSLGVRTILGGEFEHALADLADAGGATPSRVVSLDRQQFLVPDRSTLPPLSRYAPLVWDGELRRAGYTEASRGCKHLCRHCPIVPVYHGLFRVVQHDVVMADIRQQVEAGAEHITFGDPDFFNGPGHSIPLVKALHREFPAITYDVTIKVEHLLRHCRLLPMLRRTGCLFVTTAAESIDDAVLARLQKGHTRRDILAVLRLAREVGLTLAPTFVAFTPWTTLGGYRELLRFVAEQDLVANVSPIQLAIRLLIPAGSRLLELEEVRRLVGAFDRTALAYPWCHPDTAMDALCERLQGLIKRADRRQASRAEVFAEIWNATYGRTLPPDTGLMPRATIPYLNEPWYC